MTALKIVLTLAITLFMVSFAAMNHVTVAVDYYFGRHYEVRLWVVVFTAFFAGLILAAIGWGIGDVVHRTRYRRLSKAKEGVEKELADLKARPMPDLPPVYPARTVEPQGGGGASNDKALPPGRAPLRLGGDAGPKSR